MMNPPLNRREFSLVLLAAPSLLAAREAAPRAKMPRYRIDPADFNCDEADLRAVCNSAGGELWKYFPDYDLEPFVVTRGKEGPISLFQRNERKEIVIRLDSGDRLWAQISYQFAHEFCHVLCGFRAGPRENLWFEETLCETASHFVMRAMARSWKNDPPYENWRDYRDSLRQYSDDSLAKLRHVRELSQLGTAAFFERHLGELRKNPTDRELNGALASLLLREFEADPSRWEAIRWINQGEVPANETFESYLARWRTNVPDRHAEFIQSLASLFGRELPR